jgi:hypothetical protein
MRPEDSDSGQEKAEPCAVCGRPSGCAAWGFRLCYGEVDGSRVGCVSKLSAVMPEDGAKEFTQRWVAEQRKARAA